MHMRVRRAPCPCLQPPFRFLATYYVVESAEHLIGGFRDPPKRGVDWEPVSLATLAGGSGKAAVGRRKEEGGRGTGRGRRANVEDDMQSCKAIIKSPRSDRTFIHDRDWRRTAQRSACRHAMKWLGREKLLVAFASGKREYPSFLHPSISGAGLARKARTIIGGRSSHTPIHPSKWDDHEYSSTASSPEEMEQ